MKHTPGPWRVENDLNIVVDNRGFKGCGVLGSTSIPHEERKANTTLAASAPEMLEVLKTTEAEIVTLKARLTGQFRSNMESLQTLVRAAIDKAEGKA